MEKMVSLQLLENTFKGKKIFLTGHTGFKGAWMLKILSLLGADIMGYSLEPKTPFDLYNLIEGDRLCNSIIADIRDKKKLEDAIVSFQPDFVFHLAAQPLVRLSYEIPVETFEVNVIGTANILEGVKKIQNKCSVILITTDKVYHNNEWIYPYRENDRLGGYDPYSASKACAELLIDSYRNSFFNSSELEKHLKGLAVARAGNVIGGGDWSKDRLIPDIVRSLKVDSSIIIRNPQSVRPWQHVLEPVFGYLILATHLESDAAYFSQAFNFGPLSSDALSVEEILKLSIAIWGHGNYQIVNDVNNPHEAGLLKLDISKVNADLNWIPRMSAKHAVKITLDWYKCFENNPTMINDFTTNQILNYLNGGS